MCCYTKIWHTGICKPSSAVTFLLLQKNQSFHHWKKLDSSFNTVHSKLWGTGGCHSGLHAHLNLRWAKRLGTKPRAKSLLTSFYKHVKNQLACHLNEIPVISRILTTLRFTWPPKVLAESRKNIAKRIHMLLDNSTGLHAPLETVQSRERSRRQDLNTFSVLFQVFLYTYLYRREF